MSFFTRFPYTNVNNINLDWILDQVKNVSEFAESESARIDAAESDASSALTNSASALAAANAANGTANSAMAAAANAANTANSAMASTIKAISIGSGSNLLEKFTDLAALHAAVAAGDFSNINVGDYFMQNISGSYKEYSDGSTKSMNASMKFTVAGINSYLNASQTVTVPHLVLVSSVWPIQTKINGTRGTYYDATETTAWAGSALFHTFNEAEDGIISLLTGISPYLLTSITMRLPAQASGAAEITGNSNVDIGALHPPMLRELTGNDFSVINMSPVPQLPLFMSADNVVGKFVNGNKNTYWIMGKVTGNNNLYVTQQGGVYERADNAGSTYPRFICLFA